MDQPLVKLLRRNRMDPRAKWPETRKSGRKRLRGIHQRSIRDWRKSKRGSTGCTLQETAPRSSKDRIQIWLVHGREEVYPAQAHVVKINEKLAQTKKKGRVASAPTKNRRCITPNSTADSTS